MSESTVPGGGIEPPLTPDAAGATRPGVSPGGTATKAFGALLGAVAGGAAGLGTMIVGPVGALVGAIIGAEIAELGSQTVAANDAAYTPEHDEHYRSLWESAPDRLADATFDSARPAYRFGHGAAFHPAFVGRDFIAAEADLRALWDRDAGARHGGWTQVRRFVCDAYGHSRSENFGLRRAAGVIGTGGSAVDPVELARARAGLASNPDAPDCDTPPFPADLASTAPNAGGDPHAIGLGERAELRVDLDLKQRTAYH